MIETLPQTFATFMDEALYGPDGYYSSGRARSGREGDYFTAPDVGPVFGRCLAELLIKWEERLAVSPLSIVECGAGEGALAESIIAAISQKHFRYVAIERSPVRQNVLTSKFGSAVQILPSLKSLIAAPLTGVILANELIDAFPVHRVRMHAGKLEEAFVSGQGNSSHLIWDSPTTPRLAAYLDRLGITLPESYETEINLKMGEWIGQAAAALQTGLIVLIDYGRPAHELYAPERDRGTLRAFREHRVSDDWLGAPGQTDLTSDVDFTSLALEASAAGLLPLAYMELGAFLLNAAGSHSWSDQEARGLNYLIHPEGLGSAFHVLVLGKGIEAEQWPFEHNRIRRLGLPS